MLAAVKVLAATMVDLMQQPQTLAAMRAEFDKTTGGKKFASSIPLEVKPPVLPNPYENPGFKPSTLDYPSWTSFVWTEGVRNR